MLGLEGGSGQVLGVATGSQSPDPGGSFGHSGCGQIAHGFHAGACRVDQSLCGPPFVYFEEARGIVR